MTAPQLIVCEGDASEAAALFACEAIEVRSAVGLNGEIKGRHVVLLGDEEFCLAFAAEIHGYAASVATCIHEGALPADKAEAVAWARSVKKTYTPESAPAGTLLPREVLPASQPAVGGPDETLTTAVSPRRGVDTAAEEPQPSNPVNRAQDDSGPEWPPDYPDERPDAADEALRSVQTASSIKAMRQEQITSNLAEAWPEPADPFSVHPLPAFDPVWAIPALRPLILNIAAMQGCDPGIPLLQAYGFAAGCLSHDIRVRVRPSQDWTQPALLWLCVVGESGDGKSPSMTTLMREARELRLQIGERHKARLEEYDDELEIYVKQRAAWIAARAKGDPGGLRPTKPIKPVNEQLYFTSTTSEGLLEQQEASTRGTMCYADEFIGWLAGMDQYKANGRGNDRQFWLGVNDGAEFVGMLATKHRNIPNTGVTIIGGSQPSALRRAVTKMNLDSDGLLQRVLVYNSAGDASEDAEIPADRDALTRWRAILGRLYHMRTHLDHCVFSENANRIRKEAFDWIRATRKTDIPDAARQALSKWRGFLCRIALTMHAIECADQGAETVRAVIDEHTMAFAFEYMRDCLWPHALHFYGGILGQRENEREYRALCLWLLSREDEKRERVTIAEFVRGCRRAWENLKTEGAEQAMILRLIRAGILRPATQARNFDRLPSAYAVNPLFFEQHSDLIELERERRRREHHKALSNQGRAPGED